MTTHADIRTAVATLVETVSVSGITLRASRQSTADGLLGTDSRKAIAIALEEAPGDEWDGTRTYLLTLQAMALRGADEVLAQTWCSEASAALRSAMLTASTLATIDARVTEAIDTTIRAGGDTVVLTQTYRLQADA